MTAATHILPYLPPPELSTLSLTCKTLHKLTQQITSIRSSDASRTFEKHPIPFLNPTSTHHPYTYFIYTKAQVLTRPGNPTQQPWGLPELGFGRNDHNLTRACDPTREVGGSGGGECGCGGIKGSVEDGLIWECGCGNKVGGEGVVVKLKIVRSAVKGWGLFCDEGVIRKGELLTTKEARRRQQIYDKFASTGKHTFALLVVREHLPSGKACLRINIDATRIGNVARFINHSCDGGNLSTVLVRSSGALLPRVCFFASRDILKNEELTFSYGEAGQNPAGAKCFCGSSCCTGLMPSEQT
ncbi:histone-lysine N-methyltransferase SUVR3 [Tanacetum coccineum]